MEILQGIQAGDQQEAIVLALQAASVDGVSNDVVDMFTSLASADRPTGEAEKIIGTAIRNRYGGKATWRADWQLIPVPKLHYQSKDIPQLVIEITVYVIAVAKVKTLQNFRTVTLVGNVGKLETMAIPIVFLHALLGKDLRRFAIVERDATYTTWEMPGSKPVRLPHQFISELAKMLEYQPVVTWLGKFGYQGTVVAPLVAGSLLGLMFQDSTQPTQINEETASFDNLIKALESMAFKPAEAREMVKHAASRLRADMTLEEAIRTVLQTRQGGN